MHSKDVLKEEYNEEEIKKVANKLYGYYHSPKPYVVQDESLETLFRLRNDYRQNGYLWIWGKIALLTKFHWLFNRASFNQYNTSGCAPGM